MSQNDWEELVDRHLRGELTDSEKEQLAERLDSDQDFRRFFVEQAEWDTCLTATLREQTHGKDVELSRQSSTRTTNVRLRILLAIAAALIVALSVSLLYQQEQTRRQIADMKRNIGGPIDKNRSIAKITGLSGSLIYTGDKGEIIRKFQVGTELAGGTIEGLGTDSWFELEFKDRSKVSISGTSMLTFSDLGQKKLRLREGTISADVRPQPKNKPMLLITRTASLKVIGTQFRVDVSQFSTTLNVSEGKVQLERRSDGGKIDVPAGHRVVAVHDQELHLTPVPQSVDRWKSALELGSHANLGRWSAPTDDSPAELTAVPFMAEFGKTIYAAAFGVSVGDRIPVVLSEDSCIRVRGHMDKAHQLFVGVTLRQLDGNFAGRFQIRRPVGDFEDGKPFEVVIKPQQLVLDPTLMSVKDRLPKEPSGLVIESIWCHSLFDPVGLSITEVELLDKAFSSER